MRIDSTGNPVPPAPTPATRAGARTTESTSGASAAGGTEAFEVTGELASLLAAVRRAPDVRADVVREVAARAAAGEFNTPEAAADAAKKLLDDASN